MSVTSSHSERIGNAKPWYAQLWPWLLMLGPVAVIVAGAYTSWLAFSRQDAMVVDDYYKQGKAVNQDLRRDRAASALSLSFHARFDATTGVLHATLLSFGMPIAGKVRLYLAHSTQPEKDLNLQAQADSQGQFSVSLPMLEMARWDVTLESEQREWRLVGGWKWPQQRAIEIKAESTAPPT